VRQCLDASMINLRRTLDDPDRAQIRLSMDAQLPEQGEE
jgi:hypothetical protein